MPEESFSQSVVTHEMVGRAVKAYDEYFQRAGFDPLPLSDGYRPLAMARALTAALAHDTTEPKEHKTMQTKLRVTGVDFIIDDGILIIKGLPTQSSPQFIFTQDECKQIIAFIQQWLDHDPEAELIGKIEEIRNDYTEMTYEESHKAIIAAVREHDARYGKG